MQQTSRGKFDRLPRATARSTTSAFDGYGLRDQWPARPAPYASYTVLVHRLASLLHASFRPASRRRPCALLSLPLHQDVKRTSPSKASNMLGPPQGGRGRTRGLPTTSPPR